MRPSLGTFAAPVLLASLTSAQTTAPFYETFNDEVLYDLDGDESTTHDQVRLNGNVALYFQGSACSGLGEGVEGCGYDLKVGATAVGVSSLMLEAEATATVDFISSDPATLVGTPLFEINFLGTTLACSMRVVGGVVVTGTVEAGASADFTGIVPFSSSFQANPGFSFGVTDPPQPSLFAATPQVDATTGAELLITPVVGVEFQVTLNGLPVPSPTFSAFPGARFAVNPFADPWWSLEGEMGLYFSLGYFPFVYVVPLTPMWTGQFSLGAAGTLFEGLPVGTDVRWARAYDYVGTFDFVNGAAPAGDGSSTMLATDSGLRSGVVELASNGDVVEAFDWVVYKAEAICETDAGTHALAGTGGGGLWVGEYIGGGAFAWASRLTTTDVLVNEIAAIAPTPDGGYVLGGSGFLGTILHQMVLKVDSAGTLLWAEYLAPSGVVNSIKDLVVGPGGEIAFTGHTLASPNHSAEGAAVTVLNPDGFVSWQRVVVGNFPVIPVGQALAVAPDGGYVVTAETRRIPGAVEPSNVMAIKFDSDGLYEWQAFYSEDVDATGAVGKKGNSFWDRPYDVIADEHGYVLCGVTDIGTEREAWLWRIDPEGRVVNFKRYAGDDEDELLHLRTTPDGGLLAIGQSKSFAVGLDESQQILLLKTGSDGMVPLNDALGGAAASNPRIRVQGFLEGVTPVSDPPTAISFTGQPLSLPVIQAAIWSSEDVAR